ncbi:RNA polymerase II transcription factor B subunit 1 [Tilletia horrida]|nr:RNA polymerase II transcription factor B subunit 1 [Tilletia horrida]
MPDTGGSGDELHAAVSLQNVAGTLSLAADVISWRPSNASSGSVTAFALAHRFFAGLSVSKAGSASTVMLLKLDPDAPQRFGGKLVLYFVAEPQQAAIDQREAFKDRLTAIIRQNKARAAASSSVSSSSATPAATATAAPSPARASAPASPAQQRSRDASTAAATPPAASSAAGGSAASNSKGTGKTPARPSAYDEPPARTELQMRIDILKAHPALLALHRQVVHSKIMTDAEFWSHPTRLALLRAERAAEKQKRGRNARLADPQKSTDQGGEIRYSLTPQIVRDMFEQYPVVARAYAENVPDKLSEQDFWRRYFSSRLYSRLRTSTRSAASEHVIRDDEIFDQYLQDEDDDLEPKRTYNPHDALVDLAATANDHDQTGNERDWTMRPGFGGGGKRALPLLRRFNEHSQSLLDSALGEQGDQAAAGGGEGQPPAKKRRIVGGVGEEYAEPGARDEEEEEDDDDDDDDLATRARKGTRHLYENIVIDELEEGRQRRTVPLNIQSAHRRKGKDRDRVLGEGDPRRRAADAMDVDMDVEDEGSGMSHEEIQRLIADELEQWPMVPTLGSWKPPARDNMVRTMKRLLNNVLGGAGRDFKHETGKGLLGDALHKSLLSSHAATIEFLRQFWSAVAPASAISLRLAKQEDGALGGNGEELSPAQRRTRALRMAAILGKTETRIEDLRVQVRKSGAGGAAGGGGAGEGVGEAEQRAAALAFIDRSLHPTMSAVARALSVAHTMYNFRSSG